jgi:hypothetical protein
VTPEQKIIVAQLRGAATSAQQDLGDALPELVPALEWCLASRADSNR